MDKIGIIGSNKSMCSPKLYEFGAELGLALANVRRIFVFGGLGGVMEAVCKGVKSSPISFYGQTVGILPDDYGDKTNPYIDTIIPSGIGIARNLVIINSSGILIALGGGAGTLSEIAFAWQRKKKVLCVTLFDGWAKELAGKDLDNRASGLLIPVSSIDEIVKHLANA
jgi:uncharacterized protein (TIGR00725 family)